MWFVPWGSSIVCVGFGGCGWRRWGWLCGGVVVTALFGAWPGSLWGQPTDLGGFSEGFIWAPPNTSPGTFARLGDRPSYVEYHWHGLQLVVGNLYVLTGLAVLIVVTFLAVRLVLKRLRKSPPPVPARPAALQVKGIPGG